MWEHTVASLTLSPHVCPCDASLVPLASGGLAPSLVDSTGRAGHHADLEGF